MEDDSAPAPRADLAGEVTVLLHKCGKGDANARNDLIPLVYPELRRIAGNQMRSERLDHTLQATALINEFFLELARKEEQIWVNRSHFLAAASQAMRRFLIDYARGHNSGKRGGHASRVQLDEQTFAGPADFDALLELDEVLTRLAAEEPRMAQVFEMRCFGGLSHKEIAEAIGKEERTVKRDWQVAVTWLKSQLRRNKPGVWRAMGAS